ncbi:hypothetical protein LTR98_006015 [Exophiala xenobiotica]|nr:hypothetical protein LTR98_006015 [Exophiala xenobiotica]
MSTNRNFNHDGHESLLGTSSHSRSEEQKKHHHHGSTSHASQQQANYTLRPATAPANHHVPRPTRSRSRLQKRASSQALTTSTNGPTVMAPSVTLPPSQNTQNPMSLERQSLTALPQLPEAIPHRSSSLRQKTRPRTTETAKAKPKQSSEYLKSPSPRPSTYPSQNNLKSSYDDKPSSSPSHIPPQDQSITHPPRTPRHVPLAPYDPSPLNPLYHIPSPDVTSSSFTSMSSASTSSPSRQTNTNSAPNSTTHASEHVILPPGFRPGTSTHTDVETIWHPAVTHQVVKEHTIEVVQEAVTREIHVHHYYTHVQPIKAVEVLPARHFIVDPTTGQKVEIPAPEGWEMPADLRPRKPDTSVLEPMSRHYLVDEEHPTGVPELPPQDFKRGSQQELNTVAKATHAAKWSPFPKVNQ